MAYAVESEFSFEMRKDKGAYKQCYAAAEVAEGMEDTVDDWVSMKD